MITHMTVGVKCGCGCTHNLPVDIEGKIAAICRRTRRPRGLALDVSQMRTLMAAHPENGEVRRSYTVHRAGSSQRSFSIATRCQCCQDCGAVLVEYQEPITSADAWYTPGSLVTLLDFYATYLVKLPLNPLREVRCFQKAS